MSTTKPRIGITLGDCAGIGPEIVELALKSGRVPDSTEYVVLGRQPNCKPGEPTPETARAAAAALEEAVTLARRGELEAIVTGPVHKARMYEVGFRFPGQTEFFAERCGVKNFAMCLTGGKLTVALVTAHIPSAQSPASAQAVRDSARRPVARGVSALPRQECAPHCRCRTQSSRRRIRQTRRRRN